MKKNGWTLVDKKTKQELELPCKRCTSKGEFVEVTGGNEPHKPSSSGWIWVKCKNGDAIEYYPSVCDMEWIKDIPAGDDCHVETNCPEISVPARPTKKLYVVIARLLCATVGCIKNGNVEWQNKHKDELRYIEKNLLPSGSGFDVGTKICMEMPNPEKITLITGYHHMDENGGYDGWTEHKVIIAPSLQFGFNIRITGRNKNDIKEYMTDVFNDILDAEYIRKY